MNEHLHIIDDLLVKYLLGEATPQEIETVQDWLSAASANQHYYEQVRLIWEKSLEISRSAEPIPLSEDAAEEKAWSQFRQRIHAAGKTSPSDTPKTDPTSTSGIPDTHASHIISIRPLRWPRIAASFLLPITLACLTWWWSAHQTTSLQISSAGIRPLTDTLPDGSTVLLNKHSVLSRPKKFNTRERSVELRGEAFFTIAADKNKPFVVHAGTTTITVLGTSFDVHMQPDSIIIVVETGQIKINKGDQQILLNAKEKLRLGLHDTIMVKQKATNNFYNYYRPLEFDCKATPLGDLIRALNEAYDSHIEIDDPSLQSATITTTFKNESLDHILSVLRQTFALKEQRIGDRIILH